MGFEVVDGYLLGDSVSKVDVVAALLATPADDEAAAPFYRALQAVGVRAADEAFIALRLVLAGKIADDVAVRRIRALCAVARACARGDAAGLAAALKRDRALLGDLPAGPSVSESSLGQPSDTGRLEVAAKAAYYNELRP